MATISTIPQLVDKKGGSYAAIAPKLEPGKFNKWKKCMLCYLAGEPYYIQCIKDGPFKPKTTKGAIKPEAHWTQDERRVVFDNEEVTQVKVLVTLADDELTVEKNHARNGELIDITMRKVNILLSKDEDVDWQNYLNQVANESLKPTKTSTNPESLKDSKAGSLTPLPPLKTLQGASPSSEVESFTFQPHSPKERPGLGTVTVSETESTTPLVPTKVKNTEQESKLNELTKLVQMLMDEKINTKTHK
ncbi:hypothetical protein Tco_0620855 [Tanacetum coccineum]